jgi:hypothetical protein
MRLSFLVLMILFSACALMAQEAGTAPPPNVDSIYLAKDDGTGKARDAATSFVPTDVPIYCVVTLDSSAPVTVKMNLIASKVSGVKADSKVLSVSYTTKNGQNRVNFTGKPDGKWVVGTYRVDIFVNDKFVQDVTFDIKPTTVSTESATLIPPASGARSAAPKKRN